MAEFDVVIVGAGHNGLITAAYLARAGAKVLVAERRSMVGGACVTEEVWPGFRINRFAYSSGLLRPQIVEDLELAKFGYDPILPDPQAFAPQPDGRGLTFWVDEERNVKEIARFSNADARAYPRYLEFWDRVLDVIEPAMMAPPVPLHDFLAAMPGTEIEGLIRDLFLRSARDFLDDWFESEELKGALATGAIIGTFAGPGVPGTAYVLGHHNIGVLNGHRRVWGHARGGMGRITEAIAASARQQGVVIVLADGVRRLLVDRGKVAGVELESGRTVRSGAVASSVGARRTFLELLAPDTLEAEFVRKVRRIRARGASLKFNAALSGLPRFRAAPSVDHLAGAVDIAPSMDYLDRAYDEAKFGRFSSKPYVDAYFQSLVDPSVAPAGSHTMTCFVQYAPTTLRGTSWDDERERAKETVVRTLEEYAPGIGALVQAWEVVTPQDLESILGLPGGNIDQGDITPDQIFSLRPVPGWSGYRTPVEGLYLCGSATHPGGGVIGAPGYNAAGVIIEDLRRAN